MDISKYINQLKNANTSKKTEHIFNNLTQMTKHLILRQIFYTNDIVLGQALLIIIINDTKPSVHGDYVNLLCITLARTHDKRYLRYIVEAKMSGDLFYRIDSTLLFEFSPNKSRATCVKDTLAGIDNIESREPWAKQYKEWVKYYSSHYDESVVTDYWNKYGTVEFKDGLDCILHDMELEGKI